ncbi:unnamed protein product [Phytophthora fragariaefolia]|uniref:Unnamed protein product n=1 Tax=Phytophthora fragariaefolia TaxID=1490495 RepID=A0A9W7CS39_9STRA|nr:unnamed protein product [Phytophthora fragariaefolia]
MMVVAAIEGHFGIVRWLHEHSSAPGSPHVMDCAAEALDLPMLQWLADNRTEGCTPYAMDNAARKGSLEIVQWLHTHRTEGCTTGAMDGAAMNGHLDVLQWLHANRHEGCTASALHCAAVNGHADVVQWLDENVAVGNRRRAFASAVRWGHLEVVKVLAKYCSVNVSADTTREIAAARQRAEAEMRVADTPSLLRARRERILYSQRILDGPAEENAVCYKRTFQRHYIRVLTVMTATSVINRAVPGAGPLGDVLSTVLQLSDEMEEGKIVCRRLHARLKGILDELQTMEENGQLLQEDLLDKFVTIVRRFLNLLEHYRGAELVFRVVKYDKIKHEMQLISDGIAGLFEELGVVTVNWAEQWEHDIRMHKNVLLASAKDNAVVLRDLVSTRALLNAALTLKFEAQHRAARHDHEILECITLMAAAIATESQATISELPPRFIPSYELTFDIKPFSRGSFGSVHRGVWGAGTNVVVKHLFCEDMIIDERMRPKLETELNILNQLSHPHIIKMFGASHVSSPPFLMCEDAAGGNVAVFLIRCEANKQSLWRIMYQAALGLDYMHQKGVVHGNLKLNNILIGAGGQAKLSDFGLSTVRSYLSRPRAAIGEPPFVFLSDDDVRDNVRKGIIPHQPDEMSADVWDLVVSMTNSNPSKRPSLHDVLVKFKSLADDEVLKVDAGKKYCGACSAVVLVDFRFCSQCGTKLGEQPVDSATYDTHPTIRTHQSEPPLLLATFTSVPSLISLLGSANHNKQEEALMLLAQHCLDDSQRKLISMENGMVKLVELANRGISDFIWQCALECISWIVELDSGFSEDEFEKMQTFVHTNPTSLITSTVNNLQHGGEMDKFKSLNPHDKEGGDGFGRLLSKDDDDAITGIVETGAIPLLADLLRGDTVIGAHFAVFALAALSKSDDRLEDFVEVTPALIMTMRSGSEKQMNHAVIALGRLAFDDACCLSMIKEKIIADFVRLLRSGTDEQKDIAAGILANFATISDSVCVKIVNAKAVLPLIELLAGTFGQQESSAIALGNLAISRYISAAIVKDGGIEPLLELLRSGAGWNKAKAGRTLARICTHKQSSLSISGVIADQVKLLQIGVGSQKENAACALLGLAENDANREVMVNEGAVHAIIPLLSTGTGLQQLNGTKVLCSLACTKAEILRKAVVPIVDILRTVGDDDLMNEAAHALACLAKFDEENKRVITNAGAIEVLQGFRQAKWGYAAWGVEAALDVLCSKNMSRKRRRTRSP